MNTKYLIKKCITVLTTLSILLGTFGGVSVFAQSVNYAKADFDGASAPEGTYQGMTFAYKISKGNKIGKLSLSKSDVPYYGTMLRFDQTGSNASNDNLQFMTFTLDEGIPYGENAPANTYAEFSADVKLQNRKTGVNIELSNSTMGMTAYTYRLNIRANGELFSNNVSTGVFAPSGTNSVVNNLRIRMDLNKKAVVGIYVDDELVVDSFTSPLPTNAVTYDKIDVVKICIGNKTSTDSLYVDNVNVVTYTSDDGTTPIGSKAELKSKLDEIDTSSLTDEQKSVFDEAVLMAKNPIATQEEIDAMVLALNAFSEEKPEEPMEKTFTLKEDFEDDIENGPFNPIYGEGIIGREVYDEAPYGNNVLSIKCDTSKVNVSQYVDLELGKYKINFDEEEPNCYVELGIDFANFDMSKFGKNIFLYLRDSADTNMANLYVTGGHTIRMSGLPGGEVIFNKIEDTTKMQNVRIVMQMTDNEGNVVQNITGIYADGELLNAEYPLAMKKVSNLSKFRFMISNIKDSDAGKNPNYGAYFDNFTVSKFYSETGKRDLHSVSELMGLIRGFSKVAEANYNEGLYTEEDYSFAKEAINSAGEVYMNPESTDEEIDNAFMELGYIKKRLDMPKDRSFDVAEMKTSAGELSGKSEVSVGFNLVSSKNITKSISPTFIGFLMKSGDGTNEIMQKSVKTVSLDPNSQGELELSFDLSKYTDEEKADMYIKMFAFEDISEMKLSSIKLPVLFGSESEPDNGLYRYTSDNCAYQIADDDITSVFTFMGNAREENFFTLFKSDFEYEDFSDESIAKNLIFVKSSKFDKEGKYAIALKGIPEGEYVYTLGDVKGNFTASDKETIVNALNEVLENPEKIDDYRAVLGIDEEAYENLKANGLNPGEVLEDILEDKTYDISDIQVFVEDLLDNLHMLNDFKEIKTVGYVRQVLEDYGDRISNISEYKALNERKTVIAEEYILDNKDKITSIGALEELIDEAVEKAKKYSTSGSSGSSGGGGGGNSRPSPSVIIMPENTDKVTEKEYGNIVEVHSGEFTDLASYEWAKPAVALLAKKGSVTGKAEGIFAPQDKVTRAEFVKMILLTFGYSIEDSKSTFKDVSDDSWYKPYVMTAAKTGMVTGYSDEVFGANDNITREDAAVIIARVLKSLNVSASEKGEYIPFIDEELISEYAKDAVFAMAKSGIVNGVSGNYFAPENNATRAEAAKLIYEAYMFMVTKEG